LSLKREEDEDKNSYSEYAKHVPLEAKPSQLKEA